MARVLFGCELGNGYGHLTRLLPLALSLRRRGHEPLFVANDVARAEAVISGHGMAVYQSPLWTSRVGGLPPPRSYSDILLRHGFLDPIGLRGVVRAWRTLVSLLQPQLLVLDHAPTALLATRGLGLPRLRFGDGFCCPPLATPMPAFNWWEARAAPQAAFDTLAERNVVETANLAVEPLGLQPVTSVAQLLATEAEVLCNFAELDHYPSRPGAVFGGPVTSVSNAGPADLRPCVWPAGDAPCAFVYVRSEYPHLEALVQALRASRWRVLLHVPGLAPVQASRWSGSAMHFSASPVPMSQVHARADAVICHGGSGTMHDVLVAGKPMLLLPGHMEQLMLAQRAQRLGAALLLPAQPSAPQLAQAVQRLQDDTSLVRAAQHFAQSHAGHDAIGACEAAAARCEECL